MTWVIGLVSFAVGAMVGAIIYKQVMSDEAKVKQLEDKLEQLEREHETYKDNVHSHFNSSATLLNHLTDSYREVYRHMATGARALCPEYISEQLTHSAKAQDALTRDSFTDADSQDIAPPRDYAAKSSPDQKGSLSEDYGLHDDNDDNDDIPTFTDTSDHKQQS